MFAAAASESERPVTSCQKVNVRRRVFVSEHESSEGSLLLSMDCRKPLYSVIHRH